MGYKRDMNKGIKQVLTEEQHTPIVDGHQSANPKLTKKEADADWARVDHRKRQKAWA